METITYDKQGYVATICFNRPEKMNAITPDMMVQLYECVEEINANMDIRAVVVTGGDKVFCAGSDIKKLVTYDTPWDFHNRQKDYPTSIRLIRKPTIAMINGYCLGGGLEMAISAGYEICLREREIRGTGDQSWVDRRRRRQSDPSAFSRTGTGSRDADVRKNLYSCGSERNAPRGSSL